MFGAVYLRKRNRGTQRNQASPSVDSIEGEDTYSTVDQAGPISRQLSFENIMTGSDPIRSCFNRLTLWNTMYSIEFVVF